MLLAAVRFNRNGAALGVAQRGLEGFGDALLGIGAHLEPVDHDLDGVLDVLGQLGRRVDVVHLAVDAQAHEALCAQFGKKIHLLALAPGHHRREDHDARVLRQGQHMVDHLRHRLRRERQLVFGTVGRANAREQQAQVVVDFGHGTHSGARVVAGGFLLDGDGRRQAFDQVDIGFFHQLQELPRVGRQRLDVTPLALGVKRVKCQRTLARARQSGHHHQLVARQVEADVFQVVRACAADADLFHSGRA